MSVRQWHWAWWVAVGLASCGFAQAPKGKVSSDAPPPPLTYHGLIPGLSAGDDVRKALGEPAFEARWYAHKMLYPADGRPEHFDVIHVEGGPTGTFASVEAASVPSECRDRAAVYARLGAPQFELRMPTFSLLDYTEQGVRFLLNAGDQTIGVAYVPHGTARVHEGARKLLDLRHLRQGPQPRPARVPSFAGLTAGASQVPLTPKPEWVDPRFRDTFEVHDHIYARCVVFEKGEVQVALVGADLFGMSLSDLQPMRDQLAAEGIDNVFVAMSHNHAAPDTIGVYGFYPQEHIDFIRQQIAAGVKKAYAERKPVKEIRVASRELPMDGARVAGYIRNARNPGLVDPTLSVLQAVGANDQPIATIVQFACHVEGLEAGVRELSADFPGPLCDQIAADGGGQGVFLNGALGGMVSGDTKARTHDEARNMGLGMAQQVKDLLRHAHPPEKFDFAVEKKRIEIPVTNLRFRPLYAAKRPLSSGRVVSEMALVTLGECQILTVPGELLPELSFEIQEHMDGFPRMVLGLVNDELGYILPAEDFRDKSYEESMSQGPAAGPLVRDTAIRLLRGQQ